MTLINKSFKNSSILEGFWISMFRPVLTFIKKWIWIQTKHPDLNPHPRKKKKQSTGTISMILKCYLMCIFIRKPIDFFPPWSFHHFFHIFHCRIWTRKYEWWKKQNLKNVHFDAHQFFGLLRYKVLIYRKPIWLTVEPMACCN